MSGSRYEGRSDGAGAARSEKFGTTGGLQKVSKIARPVLTDPHLRASVWSYLARTLDRGAETLVLNEFALNFRLVIADLAVINGNLSGFEIKSDVDSLRRLERQARHYGKVFDRMTAVTTSRHSRAICEIVPRWWSVVEVSSECDESWHMLQKGSVNEAVDVAYLLDLLRREELSIIARAHSMRAYSSASKAQLCGRIRAALGEGECKRLVRRMLRARADWTAAQRSFGASQLQFGSVSEPICLLAKTMW